MHRPSQIEHLSPKKNPKVSPRPDLISKLSKTPRHLKPQISNLKPIFPTDACLVPVPVSTQVQGRDIYLTTFLNSCHANWCRPRTILVFKFVNPPEMSYGCRERVTGSLNTLGMYLVVGGVGGIMMTLLFPTPS